MRRGVVRYCWHPQNRIRLPEGEYAAVLSVNHLRSLNVAAVRWLNNVSRLYGVIKFSGAGQRIKPARSVLF